MYRGEANCAGLLTARRARYGDPEVEVLPDTLLFHDAYIYIKDLACEGETDLLGLYRCILSCRTQNTPTTWDRIKRFLSRSS